MPAVSIVIPAYNAERFISRTLDSVLAQTMTDWELIIVNDGSQDRTAAITDKYATQDSRIKVWTQPNSGIAATRNRGYAETDAGSDYVIFLDHDDVWVPGALETLKSALDGAPDTGAVHGLPRFIDEHDQPVPYTPLREYTDNRYRIQGRHIEPTLPDEGTSFAALIVRNCIISPGVTLIRRTALPQVGLFDHTCVPADDWDLWLRLSRIAPLKFVNQEVLGYRLHGANASNDISKMAERSRYVRRKAFRCPQNTAAHRAMTTLACRHVYRRGLPDKLGYAGSHLGRGEVRLGLRQLGYATGDLLRYIKGQP